MVFVYSMYSYLSILARKKKYFSKKKNFENDFPETCLNVGSNYTSLHGGLYNKLQEQERTKIISFN